VEATADNPYGNAVRYTEATRFGLPIDRSYKLQYIASFSTFNYVARVDALIGSAELVKWPPPGCEPSGWTGAGKAIIAAGCPNDIFDPMTGTGMPWDPLSPPAPPSYQKATRSVMQVTEWRYEKVSPYSQETVMKNKFVFKKVFDSNTKKNPATPLAPATTHGLGEQSMLFSSGMYHLDNMHTTGYLDKHYSPFMQSVEINTGVLVADTKQAIEKQVTEYEWDAVNFVFKKKTFFAGEHDLVKTEEVRQQNTIFAPPIPNAHSDSLLRVSVDAHTPFAKNVFKIRHLDPGDKHKYIYMIWLNGGAYGGDWIGPESETIPGLSYGTNPVRQGNIISFEGSLAVVEQALNNLKLKAGENPAMLDTVSISVRLKVRQDSMNDVFHGTLKPVENSTLGQMVYQSRPFLIPEAEESQWPKTYACNLFPLAPKCQIQSPVLVPYEISKSKLGMNMGIKRDLYISIRPVNDPPVITLPETQVIPPGAILTISGFAIDDPDFLDNFYAIPSDPTSGLHPLNNKMELQISIGQGKYTLNPMMSADYRPGGSKITFLDGCTGVAEQTTKLRGSMADLNVVLQNLRYESPTSITEGSIGLVITANDLGNSGFDGALGITTATLYIEISCSRALAPQLWYSRFDNSAARIQLYFDRPTDQAGMKDVETCDGLLSDTTISMLGKKSSPAMCSWSDVSTLMIVAGNGATLLPDVHPIRLSDTPYKKVKACYLSSFYAQGEVVPLFPLRPPIPSMSLTGPSKVGFCEDGQLDSRLSLGGGGRPLVVTWSLEAPESHINQTGYDLNSYLQTQKGVFVLSIPNILMIPGQMYTIIANGSNFLEVFGEVAKFDTGVSEIPVPIVYVEGAPIRDFKRPLDNYISAYASLSTCKDNGQKIYFEWTIDGGTHDMFRWHAKTKNTRSLYLVPGSLIVGDTYIFRLSAWMESNPELIGSGTVQVGVVPSALICKIKGGDKLVGAAGLVRLDGSDSADPDVYPWDVIPADAPKLQYRWKCTMADNALLPCMSATVPPFVLDTVLNETAKNMLPPFTLVANYSYRFSLTLSLVGKVSVTRSVVLTTVPGAPPDVSIKPLPKPKVNRNEKLTLEGIVVSLWPVQYQWGVIVGDLDPLKPGVLTTTTFEQNMVVAKYQLKEGAKYTFSLMAWDKVPRPTGEGFDLSQPGRASIDVVVNSPPSGGDLIVVPTDGLAAQTKFLMTASDWTDDPEDLPLTYAFRFIDLSGEDVAVSEPMLKNLISTTLPSEGQTRHQIPCVVKVLDLWSGIVDFTRKVWVSKPRMSEEEKLTFVTELDAGVLQAAFDRGDMDTIGQLVDSLVDVLNDKGSAAGGKFWSEIDPDEEPGKYAAQLLEIAAHEAEQARITAKIMDTGKKMRNKMLTNLENLGQFVEMTTTTIDKQSKSISKISAAHDQADESAQDKGLGQVGDLIGQTGSKGMKDSTAGAAGEALSNVDEAARMSRAEKAGAGCGGGNGSNGTNGTNCSNISNSSTDSVDASSSEEAVTLPPTLTPTISPTKAPTKKDIAGAPTATPTAPTPAPTVLVTVPPPPPLPPPPPVYTVDTKPGLTEEQKRAAEQATQMRGTIDALASSLLATFVPGEKPVEIASDNIQMAAERSYPGLVAEKTIDAPTLLGVDPVGFTMPKKVLEAEAINATIPTINYGNASTLTENTPTTINPDEREAFIKQYGGRRLLAAVGYGVGRRLLSKLEMSKALAAGSVDFITTGASADSKDGTITKLEMPKEGMLSNVSGLTLYAGAQGINVNDLPKDKPVTITIPVNVEPAIQRMIEKGTITPACQFYDTTSLAWSSKGCVVSKVSAKSVECKCTHLTDFAATASDAMPDFSFKNPMADAQALSALDMSQLGGAMMVFMMLSGYAVGCYYGAKQDLFETTAARVLQGKLILRPDGTYEWINQTLAELFIVRFRAELQIKKDKEAVEQVAKKEARIREFMDSGDKTMYALEGEIPNATEMDLDVIPDDVAALAKSGQSLVRVCWICLSEEDQKLMIIPCKCKGLLEYCHAECLKRYMKAQAPSVYNPEGSVWATICHKCEEEYQDPFKFVAPLNELSDTDDEADAPLDLEDEKMDFDIDDLVMMQRDMYKTMFTDMGLCFVCLEEEDPVNLVQPCECKGKMQFCHEECFFQWHKKTGLPKCPFCDSAFGFRPKATSMDPSIAEAQVGEMFQGTKLTRIEVFKKVVWLTLKEGHPVLCCLFIPPADSYTRPQRLTVLITTMFATFFGQALIMASNEPKTMEQKVIAGVVTQAITQPTQMLFKGIFTIGQGPKESAMSDIRKDNRETPWMRQERMLLERRYERAMEKAKTGDVGELLWIELTGQKAQKPDQNKKLYSKGMLDKLGEPDFVVDACKCVAWTCAIGYIMVVGALIALFSMRFTPNQNGAWLGMAWLTTTLEWCIVSPIGALVAGLVGALKDDMKGALIWLGSKMEYVFAKAKALAEDNGYDQLASYIPGERLG